MLLTIKHFDAFLKKAQSIKINLPQLKSAVFLFWWSVGLC